ncbi:hypothetical protein OR263_05745 [Streptomyces sp. NEAU-H22]|uniref:hypothetical protein n=1 Tax=unclassified Streptomyces TaxID=2593676 RepID=UPI002259EBB9|nr:MULTISPECIES: hypothetical protein [unclassified Streptomyces]MCX3286221.1 hypothetical protein [Streptomyces sp. NEAU-H22]WMD08817.1 hypothetical protein Q7C01_32550 [Streptomyces sp. FXY-T5]
MKLPWPARRKSSVSAPGDGAVAAGRNVINPRTEIHYHLHHPAESAGPGSSDIAPAVIFESRPVYPNLEFSIINRGRTPVQITSIRLVKASSIKAAYRGDGVEYITGPRLELEFDLRTAGQRTWTSAFSGQISNLAPHEAEAFVLNLSTKNTLNLVDIEFEYINSATPHVLMARPSEIIYVDSPMLNQGYAGSIQLVSRSAALSSLFNGSPAPIHGPAVDAYPEDVRTLFLRGTAHLCYDHVADAWHHVVRHFDGSPQLGPAVASFAEFGQACGLPDSVRDGLEAWLGDPAAIRRAPTWDYESHALIAEKGLIVDFPPQLGAPKFTITRSAAQCFKLLDSTLTLDPDAPPSREDWLAYVQYVLGETTLSMTRVAILRRLVDCYGAGLIEYLIVNLRLSSLADAEHERLLEAVLGSEAPSPDPSSDVNRIQERWRTWWESQRDFPAYSKLRWRPLSPRLANAASALFARAPEEVPTDLDELVRLAVARNPYVLDHFASDLVGDPEVQIRWELARSRHVSPKTLEILARDPSSMVRRWVASNPNTNDETLAVLSDDEEEIVRSFLNQNPRLQAD